MSLEYSWGSAGFGEKGKKGTFVWGGPASCHDNGPGAAPQVRLDPDTGGRLRWLETPRAGSSPLLRWKKVDGGRVICHSAHTRPSVRGEKSLFRGEEEAPERRTKTPTENKRSKNPKGTERPHVGSPRAKPQPRNTKNGKPSLGSPPRAKNPKQSRNPPKPCRERAPRS